MPMPELAKDRAAMYEALAKTWPKIELGQEHKAIIEAVMENCYLRGHVDARKAVLEMRNLREAK